MRAPPCLTDREVAQLLDAIRADNHTIHKAMLAVRNELIALLMIDAGCRVSEVTHLRCLDVYWQGQARQCINIPDSIAKRGGGGDIPTSLPLMDALKRYYDRWIHIVRYEAETHLIRGGQSGVPLSTRQVARMIDLYSMQAFGKHVHPHMLRHTFGNRLRSCTDLRTAQTLLRHKHISSTQIYTHPNHDDQAAAIKKMDDKSKESTP